MMSRTPRLTTSTTPAMIAAATAARGRSCAGVCTSASGMNRGSSASRSSAGIVPRTSRRSPSRNGIPASRSLTVTSCCWIASTVASKRCAKFRSRSVRPTSVDRGATSTSTSRPPPTVRSTSRCSSSPGVSSRCRRARSRRRSAEPCTNRTSPGRMCRSPCGAVMSCSPRSMPSTVTAYRSPHRSSASVRPFAGEFSGTRSSVTKRRTSYLRDRSGGRLRRGSRTRPKVNR